MAKRNRTNGVSRSGLSLVCGLVLSDGEECLNEAFGLCDEHDWLGGRTLWYFHPDSLLSHYAEWFFDQYPDAWPSPAVNRFVDAWRRDQASNHPEMPRHIGSSDLRGLHLAWQRREGQEGVLPCDLALFLDHWKAQEAYREVE